MSSDRLVTAEWLAAHLEDPKVRILEFDWNGTDSWDAGHIPGASGWYWKDFCWDDTVRDFPSPEDFAARCAAQGIANDTIVVCYGDPVQFGTYGGCSPISAIPTCGCSTAARCAGQRRAGR